MNFNCDLNGVGWYKVTNKRNKFIGYSCYGHPKKALRILWAMHIRLTRAFLEQLMVRIWDSKNSALKNPIIPLSQYEYRSPMNLIISSQSGNNPSNWLIFFRGIETTNQIWSDMHSRKLISKRKINIPPQVMLYWNLSGPQVRILLVSVFLMQGL